MLFIWSQLTSPKCRREWPFIFRKTDEVRMLVNQEQEDLGENAQISPGA